MPFAILWPTFALVALIFIVTFVMMGARMGHMRKSPPTPQDIATGDAAMRYFAPVEMPANNYRNLFEMPVLYFALVPLLMLTDQAGHGQVVLAWLYVGLRAVHSFVHIGPKKVPARALIYLGSVLVLAIMWGWFLADVVAARSAFEAVENVTRA